MKKITEVKLLFITKKNEVVLDFSKKSYSFLTITSDASIKEIDLEKEIFDKFGFKVSRKGMRVFATQNYIRKKLFKESVEIEGYALEVLVDEVPSSKLFKVVPLKKVIRVINTRSWTYGDPKYAIPDMIVLLKMYLNDFKDRRVFDSNFVIKNGFHLNILKFFAKDIRVSKGLYLSTIEFDKASLSSVEKFLKFYLVKYPFIDLKVGDDVIFYFNQPEFLKITLSPYNEEEILDLIFKIIGVRYANIRLYFYYNGRFHENYLLEYQDISKDVVEFGINEIADWYYLYGFVSAIDESEYDALSPNLKLVYVLGSYFTEVNNGGHSQFFFNSSGIFTDETLSALKEIGIDALHDILSKAAKIVKPKKDRDYNQSRLTDKVEDKLFVLDDEVYGLPFEEYDAMILAYLKANIDKFDLQGDL